MNLKLNYEEAEAIALQLKSSADAMQDILNNVTLQFNEIGDENTWAGTAASATKATFDELSAKFPRFIEAVNSCHLFLTDTVIPAYKEVDNAVMGGSNIDKVNHTLN